MPRTAPAHAPARPCGRTGRRRIPQRANDGGETRLLLLASPLRHRTIDPRTTPRHVGRPLSIGLKKPSMRRTAPLLLVGTLVGAVGPLLASCETIVDQRGFAPTPGSVEKLEVGTQSREDVVRLIGSPSAVATFNPNVWYYISQKQETWAFMKAHVIDQKVLQLTFNEAGRLQSIKNYDLADAQDITMVSRITPTAGKELTVLEQIMGNVGKFSGPARQEQPGAPTSGGI